MLKTRTAGFVLGFGILFISEIGSYSVEYHLKGQAHFQDFKANGDLNHNETVPFALVVSNGMWNIRTVQEVMAFDVKPGSQKGDPSVRRPSFLLYEHMEVGTDGKSLFATGFSSTNRTEIDAAPDDTDFIKIHGLAASGSRPLESDFFRLFIWEALASFPKPRSSDGGKDNEFPPPWILGPRVLPYHGKVDRMKTSPNLPGYITFINSEGMVAAEYRVIQSTNFMGFEIPVKFELTKYGGDPVTRKPDKTRTHLKLWGEVTALDYPSDFHIIPQAVEGMKVFDARYSSNNRIQFGYTIDSGWRAKDDPVVTRAFSRVSNVVAPLRGKAPIHRLLIGLSIIALAATPLVLIKVKN
jgi:hypothetical protein